LDGLHVELLEPAIDRFRVDESALELRVAGEDHRTELDPTDRVEFIVE
jgi:hypothetical protein